MVITRIGKSRKAYVCQKCNKDIPVGQPYLRGKRNFAKDIIRCTSCGLKLYELSSSDYIQTVGRIKECWQEDYGTGDGSWESISEALEELRDELQERLDNIPESLQECNVGEQLQERIDGLEYAIDDLGQLDYSSFITSVIDDELDEEDQEKLDRIKEEHYGNSDYDTWVSEFIDAALKANPDETQKWASQYAELAETLQENIEERIIEAVDEALDNI